MVREPVTRIESLIRQHLNQQTYGGLVGVSLSKGGNVSLTKEAPA